MAPTALQRSNATVETYIMKFAEPNAPGIILSLSNVGRDVRVDLSVPSNQPSAHAEALQTALNSLKPIIDETLRDDTVAFHVIGAADLNPPLQHNEVIVLACAIVCASQKRALTSNAVLDLTDQVRGRPMNLKSIYNSIDTLVERGLLIEGEAVKREHTGRPSRSFQVTEAGRKIFAIGALYGHQLVKARPRSAA